MKDKAICAWAAGLFEGEGCVYVECRRDPKSGSKSYSIKAVVVNTDITLLDPLKERWSGGISPHYRHPHRTVFHWRSQGVKAAAFFSSILPFVRGMKRREIELAIAFSAKYSALGLESRSKRKSPDEKADQEMAYRQLQAWKRPNTATTGSA
mgnify:CR=1 FL=1